jgi:hypothetical protein
MWDLLWTKWQWSWLFFGFVSFPFLISFHQGVELIHIIWGMNNRPVVGRSSQLHSTDMNKKKTQQSLLYTILKSRTGLAVQQIKATFVCTESLLNDEIVWFNCHRLVPSKRPHHLHVCSYVFIMRRIITETRNCFFLTNDGVQADGNSQTICRSAKTLYH